MSAPDQYPDRRPDRSKGPLAAAMMLLVLPLAGGCAAPFAAGVGLGEIVSIASLTGTVAFNKGATDLALDIATGEDCRVVEGMVREDRKICETLGSDATEKDFKGVVGEVQDGDLVVVGHQRMELHDGAVVMVAVYGKRPEPAIPAEL